MIDRHRARVMREQFLQSFPEARQYLARVRAAAGQSYAIEEVFDVGALRDLRVATRLVAKLPGRDRLGRYVRCHELARVVARRLTKQVVAVPWRVADGHVGPVEHSWLIDPLTFTVLDVYVPTRLPQVQLVDVGIHFQRDLYVEGPRRRDVRWGVVKWLEERLQRRQ